MGKKNTYKRNRRYVRARSYRVNGDGGGSMATSNEGKNKRIRKKILEKQIRRGNINPQPNISYLKIGSLNVYGINEASRYGVETLLQERNFDVS